MLLVTPQESQNENMTTNTCININDHLSQQAFDWTSLVVVRTMIAIVYLFIFCVGIFGNAGVMVKVANNKKLHSARNIFLMSLMASDFLLCLTAVPFTPVSVIMKRWVFGGVICRLIPLCQSMSVIITSLSLTAIAVDKYVHIMDVTKPPVTIGQASTAVAIIWVIACALNLPLVLSYDVFDGALYYKEYGVAFCGEFCDEIHWSSLEYKQVYGTSVMFIQFVVPMLIIMFCYTCIMRKVRADMMIDNKQFSNSLSAIQRVDAIKKKRKVNYILIMMVVAFVGAWLPLTLFNILRDYGLLPAFVSNQPFLWALLVHSTAMTTVIWNPLLFFWLTGRPRRRRRRQGSMAEDSLLISFLLASNPIRLIMKRRRRRRDISSATDDESTCYDATYTEHEFSTTAAAYAATTMAVYKADNWFKKKISTNSTSGEASMIIRNLAPIMAKKSNISPPPPHRVIVYDSQNSSIVKSMLNGNTPSPCRSSKSANFYNSNQFTVPLLAAPKVKAESLTDLSFFGLDDKSDVSSSKSTNIGRTNGISEKEICSI